MKLYAGFAKVDITPERPVPLAGFAVRQNKPYEGVHSRIYLRALHLRQEDGDGTAHSALIVSADLIWWGSDRIPLIRKTLKEKWGLEPGSVILNGTHSHSGPQTSFVFHRLLGRADPDYVAFLENRLYEAVGRAAASAEPVRVERGTGESRIGVQRRNYVNGRVVGGPNLAGPMDPEVTVIRFRGASGATKGVLVHYACHPVTTEANFVSSEFTGAAMEKLEDGFGGDAVYLFLQGCCGDINIYKSSAPAELHDDREIVRHFGEKLADTVSEVLNRPMRELRPVHLHGTLHTLPLALQKLAGREELEAIAQKGEKPYDEWAAEMLGKLDARPTRLTVEMNRLDVADGLGFVTINAEAVVAYGLFIKERSARRMLPLAYTNGMIGYIPTREQLLQGGYEPDLSTYYFHMPARFDDSVEEVLRSKLNDIIAGVEPI